MVHKLGEDLKDSLAKKDMRETVIEYQIWLVKNR